MGGTDGYLPEQLPAAAEYPGWGDADGVKGFSRICLIVHAYAVSPWRTFPPEADSRYVNHHIFNNIQLFRHLLFIKVIIFQYTFLKRQVPSIHLKIPAYLEELLSLYIECPYKPVLIS